MNPSNKNTKKSDTKKIGIIFLSFLIIFISIVIFLFAVSFKMVSERNLPRQDTTKLNVSVRGSIYSADGFELALSKKLYKASVNTQSISKDKRELFINLFSIYSGMSQKDIEQKISRKGYIVLSYNIDAGQASSLKQLNGAFLRYGVFEEYKDHKGRIIQKMGLNIEASGNNRSYTYKNVGEPFLGHIRKIDYGNITKTIGVKGIEKSYEELLRAKDDGIIKGKRDVGFNVIINRNTEVVKREDGLNVILNIPLKLQKKIEDILDQAKETSRPKEIVAAVLDSKSGKILALASSNRFNPNRISQNEVNNLNLSAIENSYEPGSTIKPIVYAILLEKDILDINKTIGLHDGIYKLGKYTIRDTVPLKEGNPKDILIKSSNIGMVKLSKNIDAQSYHNALMAFGFGRPTGIDLPYEHKGVIRSAASLKRDIYKATISYGYGMRATFIQQLRAYAAFSNGGYLITPSIVDRLIDDNDDVYRPKREEPVSIISESTAKKMEDLLVQVVKQGSARNADVNIESITIGGKTGTARIVKEGSYGDLYNGSFFGFAKDKYDRVYTIGVVSLESNINDDYYGSQTAAPIFKKIVELLIEDNYLKVESDSE